MDCRGPSYYGKHGISRVSGRKIELAYVFRAKNEEKWVLFEFSRDACGTVWGFRGDNKGMHPKQTNQGGNPLMRVIRRLSICLFSKFLQEVSFYRRPKMPCLSTDLSTQFTPTRRYILVYIYIYIIQLL